MKIDKRLTILFGEKNELSMKCETIPATYMKIESKDLDLSFGECSSFISELEHKRFDINDIKEKISSKEEELNSLDTLITENLKEIDDDFEEFDRFPDDIESEVENLSSKIPTDLDIKNFEEEIQKIRNGENSVGKSINSYKIVIGFLLILTIITFAVFGSNMEFFRDSSLFLSILLLVFTFTIIIFLNFHRNKVDILKDLQDKIDDKAKQFDSILLDKIKLEERLMEILQMANVKSKIEFKKSMEKLKDLKKKIADAQSKHVNLKKETFSLKGKREELLSKLDSLLSFNNIYLEPNKNLDNLLEILNTTLHYYNKILSSSFGNEPIGLKDIILDRKYEDRIALAYRFFLSMLANSKIKKPFHFFLKESFMDFGNQRFEDIIDLIVQLALSDDYRLILSISSSNHYNIISRMIEERKIEFQMDEQKNISILTVD
jgi:hypothetical protein